MVRAGEMRHQVQLQVRSTVQDPAGEPIHAWNIFATRRAAIQRTPGQEIFASAQREGRVPVVLKLRWLDGVTDAMRLIFLCRCCSGRGVHDIKSPIDPDGRREELLITAEEHVEASP